MRIYADFNEQIDPGGGGRPGLVLLDPLGTLRDLCAAKLKLREGLVLTLYTDSDENEDLEIEATARWISDAGATAGGYWVGEFIPENFREVPKSPRESVSNWFPCSVCGANLAGMMARSGLSLATCCSDCGARVYAPIAQPDGGV